MAQYTRVQLADMIRQRADAEDDGNFVSDDELYVYINDGLADLYDLQLTSERGGVFSVNAERLTRIGKFAFQLPADFYKLKGVHYYYGSRYYPLQEIAYTDYPYWASRSSLHVTNGRYTIRYDQDLFIWELHVFPDNVTACNLAVMYVPRAPQLNTDTAEWDDISGWKDYVVASAAIKCLTKEESDTSALQVELQRYKHEIITQAGFIDAFSVDRIRPMTLRPSGYWYDD